jgi:hypothetical protein
MDEDEGFNDEDEGFNYNSFAFNGLTDEQLMHAEFEAWLEELGGDEPEYTDSVHIEGDSFQHQFQYQGWSVVDHYFDYEKFDDDRLVFYIPNDTGSLFSTSEGYDRGPQAEMKHANDQLLLEIRLSVLLNRLRCK